jgi:hypothetical protein
MIGKALLLAAVATGWGAETTQAAPKTVSYVVTVTNHRSSPVTTLGFGPEGSQSEPRNLLKAPIRTGATAKVTVRAMPGVCSFSVVGRYEDGTDLFASGLNICEDRTLTLVD